MARKNMRRGFSRRTIPLPLINILPQHRVEFPEEAQQSLTESIWRDGLFSRPIVARLSRRQTEALIALKNTLKRDRLAPFALADLLPADEIGEYFFVLIAGERRIRAARYLYEARRLANGNHEASPLAQAFRRELRKNRIAVELAGGEWLDANRFLELQSKENSYHAPSVEELAAGYRSWYDQLRVAQPELTVREFATKVGKAPGTVREYFAFLEIEPSVRSRLQHGVIKSSLAQALEYQRLTRVARALEEERVGARRGRVGILLPTDEEQLRAECKRHAEQFAQTLLAEIETGRYSAQRIRKEVDAWRASQVSPQLGLFSGGEEQDRVTRTLERRRERAIEGRFTEALNMFVKFVIRVSELFERGDLGLPTSPFASEAVIRVVLTLHGLLLVLLPRIRKSLEHPDWRGKQRPASPAKVDEAHGSLEREDVAPLQAALQNEQEE